MRNCRCENRHRCDCRNCGGRNCDGRNRDRNSRGGVWLVSKRFFECTSTAQRSLCGCDNVWWMNWF